MCGSLFLPPLALFFAAPSAMHFALSQLCGTLASKLVGSKYLQDVNVYQVINLASSASSTACADCPSLNLQLEPSDPQTARLNEKHLA